MASSPKKLRRLADCLKQGQKFRIKVAGERISIPATVVMDDAVDEIIETVLNKQGRVVFVENGKQE